MIAAEEHLLMKVPAVATLIFDWESTQSPWRQPTVEEIQAVGNLPYVRTYDFTFQPFFYSDDLVWPFVDNPGALGPRGRPFLGRGVNNPEIAEIATDVFILTQGRVFTQEEIDNNALVTVIPQDFAQTNELTIGSIISFENLALNFFAHYGEDDVLDSQVLEMEVIGIISRDHEYDWGDPEYFYMPIGVAEEMLNFITNAQLEFDAERFRAVGQGVLQEEPLIETVFVLQSPRDLGAFIEAASDLLSDGWMVVGIDESIFAPIVASMDIVLQLADSIKWGAIIASTIILTLIIRLFLYDRRHEIGIYMALGEKKRRVVFQILTEVGIIAIAAMILTIFTGSIVSDVMTRQLFERHLIEQADNEHFSNNVIPRELLLFIPMGITVEEAMELFDVTLDATILIIYSGVGILVVSLSTILPIWYTVRLEPKKLLL